MEKNQYQQKSEVLYTFTTNTFYAYLLNVAPSKLVFFKTYNTEFDDIIITFTGQNGRLLEILDKVNLTLLINKYKRHVILKNQEYKTASKNIEPSETSDKIESVDACSSNQDTLREQKEDVVHSHNSGSKSSEVNHTVVNEEDGRFPVLHKVKAWRKDPANMKKNF